MDNPLVDRIVNSVLYEGYLLYPYRRSIKNAKRLMFGCVYPRASQEAQSGAERCTVRARCLVVGERVAIRGELRFLQFIERRESQQPPAAADCWLESCERRVEIPPCRVDTLTNQQHRQSFGYPARQWSAVHDSQSAAPQEVLRCQLALAGSIEVIAEPVAKHVHLVTVLIANESTCPDDPPAERDAALRQSLVSAHVVLCTEGGQFVSRIDPPEAYRDLCPSDPDDGLWPVLVGQQGQRDTLLCSPIILYDYPEVAPESPGDFFDATEIDEMLTLRIMTLTDEEKQAMAALDERGRALLVRTNRLARDQMAKLHGATRLLRTLEEPPDGN